MIYFIIAFALWVGGKIFFRNPKALKENPLPRMVISFSVVLSIIILSTPFFHCNDGKEEAKKVTLTVTNRVENDGRIYLRFSDGYTQTANSPGHGMYREDEQWYIVQKGDKVQKLIYPNGKSEYSPVFDVSPAPK